MKRQLLAQLHGLLTILEIRVETSTKAFRREEIPYNVVCDYETARDECLKLIASIEDLNDMLYAQ